MPSAADLELPLHSQETVSEEKVNYQNPLLFLKIWEIKASHPPNPFWPSNWHYHKEIEFLAVQDGWLGTQTKHTYHSLGPGDVVVLGSSQLHRTRKLKEGHLRYVVFQVDLKKHFDASTMPYLHCFSELTQPLGNLNYILHDNEAARREAYSIIMDIFEESKSRARGYEMAISSSIKRLMLLLIRNDTKGVLGESSDESDLQRLRPVFDYVEWHLGEKIAVEDVCGLINLSYHYFIKFFKKAMGLSFVDYVNYRRIKKAERLLLTQDLSIMEVGFEAGIPNMAQFYKLFKRHNHCSPKEFKQRMGSESGFGGSGLIV